MSKELAKRDMSDIGTVLEVNKGAVLQALPKSIKPDRFLRVCLNTIRGNPDLQKCTAASLYAGIMQSAQFGLEIGVLNQAHLVPYWNSEKRCFEAQFQVGYLGLRDLAERYGDVIDGDAQAVHEKDLFDYAQGNEPYVTHKPSKDQDRGEIVHFYCWAQPKDGKTKIHVMSKQEVEAHRDRFVRKKKDGSFGPAWTMTFEAMGLKTVIRRCYKLLARSPELREAIALDELQEVSIPQNLGLEVEYAEREEARQTNQQRLAAVKAQQNAPAEEKAPPAPQEPAPSEPPTPKAEPTPQPHGITWPWGQNKGKPLGQIDDRSLSWGVDKLNEDLANPKLKQYAAEKRNLLDAILAEVDARRQAPDLELSAEEESA